ncbi:hypothetical protein DWW99_13705 [[Clostridium] leptum]|nr:hypothetical protein DWW99_13705 [[Clostridium] leptum]
MPPACGGRRLSRLKRWTGSRFSFILIRNNLTVKAFPGKERERKRCLRFPQKGAFWRLVGNRIFDSSGTGGKTLRLPQARKRLFVCWTGR